MYRAGIIGCGRIGCGFISDSLRGSASTHAGSYMAVDGVDLVAVCDLNREKAERCAKETGGVRVYRGYFEMLNRESLDIVSICTPPATHCHILDAVAGYRSVKAVYCEKPIAVNISAAEYMVRACEKRNILLITNHQRRFGPLHQEIACIIREGELGRIQQVTCYYGDGIANAGSHLFDLLRFYFGEAIGSGGHFSPSPSHRPSDPNIDGWLQFAGCPWQYVVPVVIQACDCEAYAIFEIDILGTRGRLRVVEGGRRAEIQRVVDSPTFEGIQELSAPQDLPQSISHGMPSRWIPRGIKHMLDCLKTGKQPISSGRDGLAALKIIEALKSSARGE